MTPPELPSSVLAMTHRSHDVDQLLRLLGMLGSPSERDFWTDWRPNEHRYGYKKIAGGVQALVRSEREGSEEQRRWAHDFADYVLLLFATESPASEAKLVDMIGRTITTGHTQTVGALFLADLRSTAWRVWRDNHSIKADTTIEWWNTPL